MKNSYLKNTNIIETIGLITKYNTVRFQSDLQYDIESIQQRIQAPEREQNFLWISRQNGTHLLSERDVFIRGTASYHTFQSVSEGNPPPQLYLLELKYQDNEGIKGNITQIDYPFMAKFAEVHGQNPTAVLINWQNLQEPFSLSYEQYLTQTRGLVGKYGPIEYVEYQVEREPVLQSVLAQNRANTMSVAFTMERDVHIFNVEQYCQKIYKDIPNYNPYYEEEHNDCAEEDDRFER